MSVEHPTPNGPEIEKELSNPEQAELEKAKTVFQSFGKAYSALKIYPLDNPAVKTAAQAFAEKLTGFLDEYEELRIEVHEFSLAFRGENLHSDGEKKKSLPFLLYKDGMRELSFYQGLNEEEIENFLRTVKANADLPEEESDIINSLWERDFPHIRYIALDEFLETHIGENGADSLALDPTDFSAGKIALTPEDTEDIEKRLQNQAFDPENDSEKPPKDISSSAHEEFVSEAAAISPTDIPEIESMVTEDREGSRIKELITLLFEILFLEERRDQFAVTLNVLEQCLQEALQKSHFAQASSILNQVYELQAATSEQAKDKTQLLDIVINKAKDKEAIKLLEKTYFDGRVQNLESFLSYLQLLSPESIPLAVDILEKAMDLNIKQNISQFLQDIGEQHIALLVKIAHQSPFSLAKEIIAILGRINTERSLLYLEKFAHHQDKSIRMETVHALKSLHDKGGDKILLELLLDREEEVRILAATSLHYFKYPLAISTIKGIVRKKEFQKKSRTEKRALLGYLSQDSTEETIFLLHSLLKKKSFFYSKRADITRLCVISALEEIATPEAVNVLKEGTFFRKKRIRNSCKMALRKLAARHSLYREIEVI